MLHLVREMLREDREAIALDEPQVKRQNSEEQEVERISVMKVGYAYVLYCSMCVCTRVCVLQSCSFPSLSEALTVNWASKPAHYFKKTPSTWFIVQSKDENYGWYN